MGSFFIPLTFSVQEFLKFLPVFTQVMQQPGQMDCLDKWSIAKACFLGEAISQSTDVPQVITQRLLAGTVRGHARVESGKLGLGAHCGFCV
jgi:hypothetical protein